MKIDCKNWNIDLKYFNLKLFYFKINLHFIVWDYKQYYLISKLCFIYFCLGSRFRTKSWTQSELKYEGNHGTKENDWAKTHVFDANKLLSYLICNPNELIELGKSSHLGLNQVELVKFVWLLSIPIYSCHLWLLLIYLIAFSHDNISIIKNKKFVPNQHSNKFLPWSYLRHLHNNSKSMFCSFWMAKTWNC